MKLIGILETVSSQGVVHRPLGVFKIVLRDPQAKTTVKIMPLSFFHCVDVYTNGSKAMARKTAINLGSSIQLYDSLYSFTATRYQKERKISVLLHILLVNILCDKIKTSMTYSWWTLEDDSCPEEPSAHKCFLCHIN